MDITKKNIAITLVRDNLDNIPQYALPDKYRIEWYKTGCEQFWVKIESAADHYNEITLERYRKEFGTDEKTISQRQFFIFNKAGSSIGTSTAWFDDNYKGRRFGRVHWVAIVPGMQGRGLAKPMMTVTCNRLVELGHKRAYLDTSTARLAAINLYLKFGFRPEISNGDDLAAWQNLKPKLKLPLDLTGCLS